MDTAHEIPTEDPPQALKDLLVQKWKITPQRSAPARTRSEADAATGAIASEGAPLYRFIRSLVERGAPGSENIALLSISPEGSVTLLHSLLITRENAYDEDPALWAIQGLLPVTGLPDLVELHPIDFAPIAPFTGTDMATFESHVTNICSNDFEDLDDMAHTPCLEGDEGSATVAARGLTYLPGAQIEAFLDLQANPSIAEVASTLTPTLFRENVGFNAAPLTWLQASFTASTNTTFLLGPIRTRRVLEPASTQAASYQHEILMKHLRQRFPTHYNPPTIPEAPSAGTTTTALTLTPPSDVETPRTRPPRTSIRTPTRGPLLTPLRATPRVTLPTPAPAPPPVTIPVPATPFDVGAIVREAILAATQGVTAAMATASSPAAPTPSSTTSM